MVLTTPPHTHMDCRVNLSGSDKGASARGHATREKERVERGRDQGALVCAASIHNPLASAAALGEAQTRAADESWIALVEGRALQLRISVVAGHISPGVPPGIFACFPAILSRECR